MKNWALKLQKAEIRHALQIGSPDFLGHEVNENAHARGRVLPAQVADVVTAVIRHVLSQGGDQRTGSQRIADQVARQLSESLAVQDGLKHQVTIVDRGQELAKMSAPP